MKRANRTLFLAASVVALMVTVAHGQGQQGGRGGAPARRRRSRRRPGLPPLMQTAPKPAIANAKPVRSCESLASVALPNTTIESAVVDPNNPGICRVTAITTHPPAGRQDSHLGGDSDVELERTVSWEPVAAGSSAGTPRA